MRTEKEECQKEILDKNVKKFLRILREKNYGTFIAIPKELIYFCQRKFHMNCLDMIQQFIHQMNYYCVLNDINAETMREIDAKLSSILSPDYDLLKLSIIRNLSTMKFNDNKLIQETMPQVESVECEQRIITDGTNEYCLNLRVKNSNFDVNKNRSSSSDDHLSFILSHEQMKSIHLEMDKISQQLFKSISAK